MRRALRAILLPLWAACGSAVQLDSDAGASELGDQQWQACQLLAGATCERWYDCLRGPHFGSLEECRAQETEICASLYELPGVDPHPDGTLRLAARIPRMRCSEFTPFRYSEAMGTLAEGVLCTRGEQCMSGRCEYPLPYGCPVCYVEPTLDDALAHPCGSSDASYRCPDGTGCHGMKGFERCVREPSEGEACPDGSCQRGFECQADRCVKVAELGDACSDDQPPCSSLLTCDSDSQTCQSMPLESRQGEACGGFPPKFAGSCGSFEYCASPVEDAVGMCTPQRHAGESCAVRLECGGSLRCTSGTCQIATFQPPPPSCKQ